MENLQIIKVLQENKLEPATSQAIEVRFLPFFEQAKEWKAKAEELVVTDITQKKEMKMAREARLALKQIRVEAEKVRKSLKEDSLRYGRAVDGIYNLIEATISPIEKHLEKQEKFEELYKAKVKAELRSSRQQVLQPFMEYVPYGIDIAELPEEEFAKIVNGAKLQKEYAEQQQKREAEEREARIKKEAEERERLEKEHKEAQERLEKERKERAQAEAKLEKERKEAEAKLLKERKEAEAKLEQERKEKEAKLEEERRQREEIEAKLAEQLRLKQEAEKKKADELKAKLAAEKKAAAAPDKEKILAFCEYVKAGIPKLKTEDANKVISKFMNAISELEKEAKNL